MRTISIACFLFFIFCGSAFSQTATLSGTVKDQTGAVLPGVQVTIESPATSLSRSAITNERGDYVISLLPVGTYTVTAELPGFKVESRQGIALQVDQRLSLNFEMQVGEVSEKVLVTGDAPLVDAETSSVGAVVDNQRIVELPLNGREFQNLTLLIPGTSNPAQGSTLGFRGGISVAGTRDAMTSFTLDGVDIVNGLVKVVSFKPSVDMIQEFKVQTSTYSAEYGRTAGGQVTVTTKSGTNQLHGTLYEFLRNSVFDAKNFFDPAGPIPPMKRNNFGFTIGGPIMREKTFFFGNFEGLELRQAQTRRAAVPTSAMINGDFSSLSTALIDPLVGHQFPGNVIPRNRFNPVGYTIAQQYPQPNIVGATAQNYVSTPIDRHDIEQFTVRIDHHFSAKNNFFGRYSVADDFEEDPFDIYMGITNLPSYGRHDKQRSMSLSLTDTHVFSPSLVGEVRLGYNRYRQTRTQVTLANIPAEWGISGTTTGPNPLDFGYPGIYVTGFDAIGKGSLPSDRVDPIYQIIPSLTYTKGNHTLKFGGDATQYGSMRLNNGNGQGVFHFTGVYTGNGLGDLLLGYPAQSVRGLGDTRNPMWSDSYAFYLQDDWKVTPRLTLNLGVRYDLQTPYESTDNRMVRFNPLSGVIEITGNPSTRRDIGRVDNPASPLYNAALAALLQPLHFVNTGKPYLYTFNHDNFAPRIGLAYRILGNDRLVLRTGYGIFYQYLQGNTGQVGWNSLPFFVTQTFNSTTPQPNITIDNPFPATQSAATLNPQSATDEWREGYLQNYNLGFQLQPWNDVLIDIAYAGSKSTKLDQSININQPHPSPTGSVASRRPYQGFGNISYLEPGNSANFNSLQLRVEKRYSKGLTLAGAYTWSHSIDSYNDGDGDSGPPDSYNIRGTMRGSSTADIRQRLVTNYVYDLPFGAGKRFLGSAKGFSGWLVSGWELSGLSTNEAGRPFTVSIMADNSNTGSSGTDRPNLIGNPYLPKSQRTPAHWFNAAAFAIPPKGTQGNLGRNTMVGPTLNETDASFIKNTAFGENKSIQFRGEIFNIFNHPNLDLPNRYIDSGLAGIIFSSPYNLPPRQIQLGLKIIY